MPEETPGSVVAADMASRMAAVADSEAVAHSIPAAVASEAVAARGQATEDLAVGAEVQVSVPAVVAAEAAPDLAVRFSWLAVVV
jgi:hypothetical protein